MRRYRIREVLGRGGFGTVYRADLYAGPDFCKPVALKVLKPDYGEMDEVSARLRDEARMLGLLNHRAIVQVDGLVLVEGRWTIVMEYVHGVSVREILSERPIPVGPALEVAAEVASALHAAYHQPVKGGMPLRLLHRDIKPGNIQVTESGGVKVLDFGVARGEFESREATTHSMMLGTVPYMSPERLDLIDSHAGDIYALGVVLLEMCVGRPFGKTSSKEERHEKKRAQAVLDLRAASAPEELVQLVADALAYDPEARPDADGFERRARAIRQMSTDGWLGDWARRNVPTIHRKRDPVEEDTTWMEGGEPPKQNRLWMIGAVAALGPAAGLAFVALAIVVAALLVAQAMNARAPEAPPTVVRVGIPAPAPGGTAPAPAPTPSPPARTRVAGAPPAPPQTRVNVEGDALEVVLRNARGDHAPGAIEPGVYAIFARFGSGELEEAGTVTVPEGETVVVQCKARFLRCGSPPAGQSL